MGRIAPFWTFGTLTLPDHSQIFFSRWYIKIQPPEFVRFSKFQKLRELWIFKISIKLWNSVQNVRYLSINISLSINLGWMEVLGKLSNYSSAEVKFAKKNVDLNLVQKFAFEKFKLIFFQRIFFQKVNIKWNFFILITKTDNWTLIMQNMSFWRFFPEKNLFLLIFHKTR